MSSFDIPNVGTMASSGLTESQMQVIWQNLVLQCLGITPTGTTDNTAYSQVRISWPLPGQPGFNPQDDICFLRCSEVPDPYDTAHEIQPTEGTGDELPEVTIYTRVWEVGFIFYGPNAFDRARQVKACLYQDFTHDALAPSNIFMNPVSSAPRRNPEFFQNQWWERTDFSVTMNEQVTDTLTKNTIQSVEVIGRTKDGVFVEVEVET